MKKPNKDKGVALENKTDPVISEPDAKVATAGLELCQMGNLLKGLRLFDELDHFPQAILKSFILDALNVVEEALFEINFQSAP